MTAVPTPAVVLDRLGLDATLSHETAARNDGFPLVQDTGIDRVTVPRNRSRLVVPGWRVERSDIPPEHRGVSAGGLRLTRPLRTVLDLARVLPLGAAVAAADHAVAKVPLSLPVVQSRLLAARGRGAGAVRQVGGLVTGTAGSVLESLTFVLLVTAGLPRPHCQYSVCDAVGHLIARVDFAWPEARLVLECDGFAFHSDRAAYRRDRSRMNELERRGWRVVRVTWEDVVGRPDYVVALVKECLALAA